MSATEATMKKIVTELKKILKQLQRPEEPAKDVRK